MNIFPKNRRERNASKVYEPQIVNTMTFFESPLYNLRTLNLVRVLNRSVELVNHFWKHVLTNYSSNTIGNSEQMIPTAFIVFAVRSVHAFND